MYGIRKFKKSVNDLVELTKKQDKIIKEFDDNFLELGYSISYVLGDGWNILDIEEGILYPTTEENFNIISSGKHLRDDIYTAGY